MTCCAHSATGDSSYNYMFFCPSMSQSQSLPRVLNLRIVQSPDGISYDQTQHIKDTIIGFWFKPSEQNNRFIKQVNTPFRTDSDYERELADTLPADEDRLQTLELEYGTIYAFHFGRLCMFVSGHVRYFHVPPPNSQGIQPSHTAQLSKVSNVWCASCIHTLIDQYSTYPKSLLLEHTH